MVDVRRTIGPLVGARQGGLAVGLVKGFAFTGFDCCRERLEGRARVGPVVER